MTSDLLHAPILEDVEKADALAAAATVWATIAVIDELAAQSSGGALACIARQRVESGLRELGCSKLELWEHIVSAVERGDWASLGVARGDPRA